MLEIIYFIVKSILQNRNFTKKYIHFIYFLDSVKEEIIKEKVSPTGWVLRWTNQKFC